MPRSKSYFTRDLTGMKPTDFSGWSTRSLAELGEEVFAKLMLEASQGDPFDISTPESAVSDLRELQNAAAGSFDAASWLAVYDSEGPLGVVLPQPYPDASAGTLFYLAVMPERRGRGLGRQLHLFGLQQLTGKGVTQYRGSTDTENAAMRATFLANGCVTDSV